MTDSTKPTFVGKLAPRASFWTNNKGTLIGGGILVALMLVIPFTASSSMMNIVVFAMIFALPAIGLNLLMGLAGQVSLGQAAFFAIGAYTHAIMLTKLDLPGPVAAAIGVAAAMLVALLVGLPLMRLRGHYLALATLGLGFIVMIAVREWDVTGRTTGIYGIPRPTVFGIPIDNSGFFLWFITPFVVIGLVLALNLTRSRAGRALSAVNDSELAAESLGVNTYALRLKVFVLSAGFAALGGVFYAYQVAIVSPTTAEFHLSVSILLMVVIGGLGSVWGAVAGAFLVQFLGEGMREVIPAIFPGATGEVQLLGYGIVLILVILLLPGGLYQATITLWRKLPFARNRRAADAHATAAEDDTTIPQLPAVSTPVAAGEPILVISGLTKRYGGVVAVNDVSLTVPAGTILGLIGPNGAGKTTCFNMISGALTPTAGTVTFLGQVISGKKPHVAASHGLTRTFQNLQVFTSTDVVGNVYMGRYRKGRAGVLRGMLGLQAHEQGAHRAASYEILKSMRLTDAADDSASALPFGKQRMMEVCRALAAEPALLLLDEPMAGLSGHERDVMAELLRRLRTAGLTIVLVEHDVAQVMSLADHVAVLDDGVLIAHGDPETVRNDPAVVVAYLGTDLDEAEAELNELEEHA
ncbi:branched-chain amino acid ABC transporter ATP-binding protein/permease [Cryobacterium sp. Sr8]|uniref:Amino acid/amide ABC transporter membrane protein 2, HAAT family /amino acid/amide ABC transporter ATP-binding protein 1, HAAT family n=1 Tax=Cryobacterium psychrotolerans TaxID=386301 RepID=A0A1G9DJK3_9MICO|nr:MULTISPECIES: branched-chain amino acid ABC transporter ATP-binding protein/permease [Cryobacterium]TFD41234.1 branched-chain amino acid ABC transporter ATP-binding protein/permease [Cryobacterium sp. TMT1-2-1]TFD77243.1 branched-chain amino acid ABC transporter ATP-binding protein/permease [Cryobacterium sp. Sr8]TFD86877.1 branched-chain amino acid ABC transporter ATP-binding protein/permease [Cryobacterium psychrotolerans]SDK64029.1 amino acid/amide ABC transporter membrane protein 2, HAAT